MASKSKINRIKCVKKLKPAKYNTACSKCESSLNHKCSRLSSKEFLTYKKGKKNFCRIKCERHVEYGQKRVLSTGCNLCIHQKCTGITKAQYQNIGNNKEQPWYCKTCKANMFPFYGLSNYQFYNFVSFEISATKAKIPENKANTKIIPSSNTNCLVCL